MIDEIKKHIKPYSIPDGTNLYVLLELFNNLSCTEENKKERLTFEEFREKYIYNWREVPCNGFNDPNEVWYYQWIDYNGGE